jgi:Asp-tRNA(Asn)/Glu-tRNA(Gln) amidotransferase A subunit family amidase
MHNYKSLTAAQIAESVRTRKLSAVEITTEALHLAKTEGA